MIYIYPIGGLGNMIFHIAAIWTLAKDNNDELCLLNVDQKIESLIRYAVPVKHAHKYKYIFDRFPQKNYGSFNVVNYPFPYTPVKYQKDYQYVGFFQCEKYFKHRRDEILELLKPTDEIDTKVKEYSDLFGNISLHVRRGADHVSCSNVFILSPMEYYNKALSSLPQDLKVLIFSDNMEWCKENFIGDRFVFINEIDYISIYLMSKMKYHIIANSSFSWWGAWLSNAEQIFAPKLWFTDESGVSDIDIIPENWIRL
jgi:hypothetical protein